MWIAGERGFWSIKLALASKSFPGFGVDNGIHDHEVMDLPRIRLKQQHGLLIWINLLRNWFILGSCWWYFPNHFHSSNTLKHSISPLFSMCSQCRVVTWLLSSAAFAQKPSMSWQRRRTIPATFIVRINIVEDRHELALWHQCLLKACVKEWVRCWNLLLCSRLPPLTQERKLWLKARGGVGAGSTEDPPTSPRCWIASSF